MKKHYDDATSGAIASAIAEARFPCERDHLVACAQRKHADGDLIESLRSLPEQRYQSLDEVVRTLVRV